MTAVFCVRTQREVKTVTRFSLASSRPFGSMRQLPTLSRSSCCTSISIPCFTCSKMRAASVSSSTEFIGMSTRTFWPPKSSRKWSDSPSPTEKSESISRKQKYKVIQPGVRFLVSSSYPCSLSSGPASMSSTPSPMGCGDRYIHLIGGWRASRRGPGQSCGLTPAKRGNSTSDWRGSFSLKEHTILFSIHSERVIQNNLPSTVPHPEFFAMHHEQHLNLPMSPCSNLSAAMTVSLVLNSTCRRSATSLNTLIAAQSHG